MKDILHISNFYVLRDKDKLYLIDGGFVGGWNLLKRSLKKIGWNKLKIEGVLVTHGHLDHILNLNIIKENTGAWIAAPKYDALHYSGKYEYKKLSKVCGCLEKIGRVIFQFKEFTVDRYLEDGDVVDIWDGLKAIHLPGHTEGHMGFYSESRNIIFSGDLFASYRLATHWPPPIFNSKPELIEGSRLKLLGLKPKGIYPDHSDQSSPEVHLQRFKDLRRRR